MWNIAPYGNHEDLYTVQDNISKVHGNHLFKAGIFLSSNEKVESSGAGADRPGLPGNCTTSVGGAFATSTNNAMANDPAPRHRPERAGLHRHQREQHRRYCRRALARY